MIIIWIAVGIFSFIVFGISFLLLQKLGLSVEVSAFISIFVFISSIVLALTYFDKFKEQKLITQTDLNNSETTKYTKKIGVFEFLFLKTNSLKRHVVHVLNFLVYTSLLIPFYSYDVGLIFFIIYPIIFIILNVYNYKNYKDLSNRLMNEKVIIGNITPIRSGYLSRIWVKVSYVIDNQYYDQNIEIDSSYIYNENNALLLLESNNKRKFILLSTI